MNKAIFLDRDGTIIDELGYVCHLDQEKIYPFAFAAIKQMNQKGFKVIGITNQAAIARGICTYGEVDTFNNELLFALKEKGGVMDRFYFSPYHPDFQAETFLHLKDWRKPEPGMILQAAKDFNIDLQQSYMIGDSTIDIQAGKNAGCKTILVLTGKGKDSKKELKHRHIQPDIITDNILTAIQNIK
jgi:D-glycero-D-manno-heptose 1,7-bisphosphate phosphatase